MLVTGKIHQEGILILNIYVPNTRAKETLLKLKYTPGSGSAGL